MGKRTSADAEGALAFRKRQKIVHDVPTGEDVGDGGELRKLLTFGQDLRQARHGLQSFKRVLSGIVARDDDHAAKLTILRQYLELVKPRDAGGDDAVFLGDIMDMWSLAVQVNDDGVMSSVAVVLELVLRVTSGLLDLSKHGLGICQTLLQERQLKCIARNLSSEKGKGFVISPTLRMLREAVCLDGGACAKRVVRARAYTFASLARNLEIGHVGDAQEDVKKSSVRTNAVRFFLSCLKYLHPEGRRDLLSQRELLSHLTYMIKTDPPYLVLEILDGLRSHVLADSKIPRELKFKSFNTKTLMRFLALYSYSHPSEDANGEASVSEKAHQFLVYACTTPGAGILYPSTGLYPKQTTEEFQVESARRRNQENGATNVDDASRANTHVFNFVLSEFAAKLRPWSSLNQNKLLIAIFTAAPELIADYFYNNRSFSFDPKLSTTWMGYAAFIFESVRIPLPDAFGDKSQYAHVPPPTSILLDNILPLPLSQKNLIRCLSPKTDTTISLFATRILVEALEKLSHALALLGQGFRAADPTWTEASRTLIDAFCQRIPDMKEIVRSYKEVPQDNGIHKTMASRLLRLYYQVIPQVALAANFDVSPFFVHVLQAQHDDNKADPESRALGMTELEHLVSIASYSPGMRWFSRMDAAGGSEPSSPFTALLRLLYSSGDRDAPLDQLREVLADVAAENQFVSQTTRLAPLLQALQNAVDEHRPADVDTIWPFLDNCITRCGSSPIKYLALRETYLNDGQDGDAGDVDLLAVAMAEQLPYFTQSAEKHAKKLMAKFISSYLNAMASSKGKDALSCIHGRIQEHLSSHSVKLGKLSKANKAGAPDANAKGSRPSEEQDEESKDDGDAAAADESRLQAALHVPFASEHDDDDDNDNDGDAAVLTKWHTKGAEDLIEDGWAARVVRLLGSRHTHIRREALTAVLKMAARIRDSPHAERQQVWLLLSELAESARAPVAAGPAPSALVAFAAHALDVVRDPLHPLYPKVNGFLTRGPAWAPDKLPLAHDVLHGEPAEDDRYYAELAWFLAYVLDALRGPFDLGVFRAKRWFEKILAVGCNPYLRAGLRLRVLRIVYRATCLDGGSTTLVTRFGLLGWLEALAAAANTPEDAELYEALMRRAWATCDQDRVVAWSKDGVERLIPKLK